MNKKIGFFYFNFDYNTGVVVHVCRNLIQSIYAGILQS